MFVLMLSGFISMLQHFLCLLSAIFKLLFKAENSFFLGVKAGTIWVMSNAYPSLKPGTCVVWNSPTALRLGTYPAALWEDVPQHADLALKALNGTRTVPQICADLNFPEEWLQARVKELSDWGWLQQVVDAHVVIVGTGIQAQSLHKALQRQVSKMTVVKQKHSVKIDISHIRRLQPDLVIWAQPTAAPDRMFTQELLSNQITCLYIVAEPDGMSVGPLVVPQKTSCIRCSDLWLAEKDSRWPVTVAQMERYSVQPSTQDLWWATGLAARHAINYLRYGKADSMSATCHINSDGVQNRVWPIHRHCQYHFDPRQVQSVQLAHAA